MQYETSGDRLPSHEIMDHPELESEVESPECARELTLAESVLEEARQRGDSIEIPSLGILIE